MSASEILFASCQDFQCLLGLSFIAAGLSNSTGKNTHLFLRDSITMDFGCWFRGLRVYQLRCHRKFTAALAVMYGDGPVGLGEGVKQVVGYVEI